MTFEQIVFYMFSLVLVLSGIAVITVRNPVHAAMFLVLTFFASAVLWMLLEAEFLAIALVLVYVGAVMVLFLFVVMMLDINVIALRDGFARYVPVGVVVALAVIVMMIHVIDPEFSGTAIPVNHDAQYNNTAEIGRVLYTKYVFAFEIAAIILVVAIVAAISLTLRRREQVKKQNPSEQVVVNKKTRLKIIDLDVSKSDTNVE